MADKKFIISQFLLFLFLGCLSKYSIAEEEPDQEILNQRFEQCKKKVYRSKLRLSTNSPLNLADQVLIRYTTRENSQRLVQALLHDQRPPTRNQRCYYKSPCLRIKNLKNNTRIISGCDDTKIYSVYHNLDNTTNERTTSNADGTIAYAGSSTLMKTDDTSYMIFFCCFPLVETKGFTVLTTTKKLSEKADAEIKDFLRKNGFKDPWQYYETYSHTTCPSSRRG